MFKALTPFSLALELCLSKLRHRLAFLKGKRVRVKASGLFRGCYSDYDSRTQRTFRGEGGSLTVPTKSARIRGIGDHPILARTSSATATSLCCSANPPLKFHLCPSNFPVSTTSRAGRSVLDRLQSSLASFVFHYPLLLTIAPVISLTPMHRRMPTTATCVTTPLSSSSSLVDVSSTSTQPPLRSPHWISYGSGILDFPLFSSYGFSLVFGRAFVSAIDRPVLFTTCSHSCPLTLHRFISACLSSMDFFPVLNVAGSARMFYISFRCSRWSVFFVLYGVLLCI